MYLVGFPLLLIPFAIYNIVAFLTPGVGWAEPLTRLGLPSGAEWTMSLGDLLVALAILLLLVEIIKAHRSGGRYLMDHLLSALLLIAMAAEFYLVPRATTSTFFLLMVASLADVIGGLVALRRRPAVFVPAPEPAVHETPVYETPVYETPAHHAPAASEPTSEPVAPPVAAAPVVTVKAPAEPAAEAEASHADKPDLPAPPSNPDRP